MMRDGLSGTLRMGAIPTAMTAASLLTTPFCERHPHVRVSLKSLSSREITRRLAEFELDIAMTYLDDEDARRGAGQPAVRGALPAADPVRRELADQPVARWAEVAALPLCLLAPEMRNRRIMDANFTEPGPWRCRPSRPTPSPPCTPRRHPPLVQCDLARVAAHVRRPGRHAGGTAGGPGANPRVGLVVAGTGPESVLARALLDVARDLDLREVFDRLTREHLT